jgi:hypothetical protein
MAAEYHNNMLTTNDLGQRARSRAAASWTVW